MGKHYATISINGKPFLSYASTPGLILSPNTIPWPVIDVLCAHVFGPQEFASGTSWSEPMDIAEGPADVFTNHTRFELVEGARVDTNHVTYFGTRRFEVEWDAVEDFRGDDRGALVAHAVRP